MDGTPANMHSTLCNRGTLCSLLSHHDFSSSASPSFSGFESRQPSHVLMASYPYSPLENRYTFCSHSLRNTGERRSGRRRRRRGWVMFSKSQALCLSDELCASIMRAHRETSQYRVEELQGLRWKLFSREEIQAYQSKVYQPRRLCISHFLSH